MREDLRMENRIKRVYPSVKATTDEDRIGMVKEIFSTVTERYDFLNHFLSLRRDIAWRRFTIRRMNFFETYRLLDIATGTADLAIDAALRYPSIQVLGVDFVQEMMDLGLAKIAKRHLIDRVRLLRGDALALPFGQNSFDVAGIAFGIRNIPDRKRALQEMKRVVVPGGQVIVLEMTSPRNRALGAFYHLYLNSVLPRVAKRFSRNPEAYKYLGDSIQNFSEPEAFAREMEEAGLTRVEKHSLDFGITYLHVGAKSNE
jgi:demethylmenaquinone methyltransferase/2-methoxy-6-polyprenyl-1,4-benzoquinol methylase